MLFSIFLIGLSLQSTIGAPFAVSERAAPTALDFEPASSTPASGEYDWTSGYFPDFTIHSSCNASERHEIIRGLEEAVAMAKHAKEHILVHGSTSEIFKKYFGAGSAGAVLGWFDKIASSNRAGVIFRCDDPDQNCATQDKWAGHWRGSNASSETVICQRSYITRLPLPALCARGFNIATGRPADFWGPDLIHRLYHVDLVGEGVVDHHADGYAGCVELAQGVNYTLAATNSASLSYFATEVYAFDISIPGEGCLGKPVEEVHDDGHASANTSSSASPTSVSSAGSTSIAATRVIPAAPVATSEVAPAASEAGKECHTHDDGTLHCV